MLGVVVTLITLFDGYDTFNPAYVIHYVMQPWGLAPSQAGLLVSSGLIGFLFGAIGHGMVADRYGRRNTLLAGLWIVNVLTLLTAIFATSFASFCGLRFLTGLGLGVLLPLGTTYINELAPQRVSNSFSLWGVTFGWSLGGVAASLVGIFLTPTYGWQILYYVGALSIPLTLLVHAVLPESPKFLAARGRLEELRALMSRLRPERSAVYENASFRTAESTVPQNTDRRAAGSALSPCFADDLDHSIPHAVCDFRTCRMDSDRHDPAWRNLCVGLQLRRADAGHVFRRRPYAGHAGRPRNCRHAAAARHVVDRRRHRRRARWCLSTVTSSISRSWRSPASA